MTSTWLTPSLVAAAAPFAEFFAERGFEKIFGQVSKDYISAGMQQEDQEAIRKLAADANIVATLETYGENREKIGGVLRTSTLAFIGVIISQYEVTQSILCTTPYHLALMLAIVVFTTVFLIQLIRKKIDPARVRAMTRYHYVALAFCLLVIALGRVPEDYLRGSAPASSTKTGVSATPRPAPSTP